MLIWTSLGQSVTKQAATIVNVGIQQQNEQFFSTFRDALSLLVKNMKSKAILGSTKP